MTSNISKVHSFKTAEAGEDDRLLGSWNLTLPCLLFLMLTISYLELLKLSENCLFFWLSCQRTPTSFPHHITDWCLVISGKGLRGPTKNGSQNWIATNKGPLKSTERSLVLINVFHEEAWKGTRSIMYVVLLTCACTKNWFLEYIRTIT